jgi:hypothetical protein
MGMGKFRDETRSRGCGRVKILNYSWVIVSCKMWAALIMGVWRE